MYVYIHIYIYIGADAHNEPQPRPPRQHLVRASARSPAMVLGSEWGARGVSSFKVRGLVAGNRSSVRLRNVKGLRGGGMDHGSDGCVCVCVCVRVCVCVCV